MACNTNIFSYKWFMFESLVFFLRRWQQIFWIAGMTLEIKVNVKNHTGDTVFNLSWDICDGPIHCTHSSLTLKHYEAKS